jgi:hypothetical protein
MGGLACEQNHLSPNTGSDNTIQPLLFSIDDGDKVKMIVPNLDFGAALTAWEVGGDDFQYPALNYMPHFHHFSILKTVYTHSPGIISGGQPSITCHISIIFPF